MPGHAHRDRLECLLLEGAERHHAIGALGLRFVDGASDRLGVATLEQLVRVFRWELCDLGLAGSQQQRHFLRGGLARFVHIEHEHNLVEAVDPLQLALDGLGCALRPVRDGHHRPAEAECLRHGERVDLAFGDDEASPRFVEVLAEQPARLRVADERELLVGVAELLRDDAAIALVVGDLHGLAVLVLADPVAVLTACFLSDTALRQGLRFTLRKVAHGFPAGGLRDLLAFGWLVVTAAEAVAVPVAVARKVVLAAAVRARLFVEVFGVSALHAPRTTCACGRKCRGDDSAHP